jgi:hypothetical protein
MTGGTHYEIFFKKHAKASWALHEAKNDRDTAIRAAHKLVRSAEGSSVRVTKEKFDEEHRVFKSVPVWESGAEKMGAIKEKTGESKLPCLTPDDLSLPHARETIFRVLQQWLERMKVIPMELLHRSDLVESLEASGTDLQHAVQKVAIARAQTDDASVAKLVKQLNELVQSSLSRIYGDVRKKKLPTYPKDKSFATIVSEQFEKNASSYLLRAVIVDRLKREKSYDAKLDAVLALSDDLPEDEAAREYGRAEIDSFLGEIIRFEAGFDALLGKCKDLGETLERLTCIYDGDKGASALNLAPSAAKRMAGKIDQGELDECRTVVAQTLLKELERPRRLRPTSIRQEVRMLRELAQKLVMGAGNILPIDALNAAFQARSSRLLTPENIDDLLKHSRDPGEELDRLIKLEENIVGEENKKKLASFIRGQMGSHACQSHYVKGEGQPLERLAALTALQAKVIKGGYPKAEQAELAGAFDTLGMKVIDDSKILNAVEAGARPALDKATAFLKLATAGALPVGECTSDAQARALRHLQSQVGLAEAADDEAKPKLRAIQSMLGVIAAQMKAA